jgi:histidinol-phosphate/aromatic aminotransferase/cobyric acid decarboxylase-like protein
MNRFPLEINSDTIRLDRNECIVPSVVRKLLNITDINSVDYIQYKSPIDVILDLSKIFNISTSNIYADNGSEQVLRSIIETLDCSTWVTTSPTFELFPYYVSAHNKEIKYIDFIFSNNFTIDLHHITNTKDCGLYFVSPHNPTGYKLDCKDILALCNQYKFVVIDEAYITPTAPLPLSQLPENLIIVRTFSKMGGLTGMRFGFCITGNVAVIEKLNQFRPMYLNSITLKLVRELLKDSSLLKEISSEFKQVRNLLNVNIVAEAGNFILLRNTNIFKNYKLKEYVFNNNYFYRMTLCDIETFYNL